MSEFDPREFLLFGLSHYEIPVIKEEANYIYLNHDYLIEIEGPSLYKLCQADSVIAPFGSVESLCEFLIIDMQQYS